MQSFTRQMKSEGWAHFPLSSFTKRPGPVQSCARQMDLFSPWLPILAHSVSWGFLWRTKKSQKKFFHICNMTKRCLARVSEGKATPKKIRPAITTCAEKLKCLRPPKWVGKPIEEWRWGYIAKYMGAIIHHLII